MDERKVKSQKNAAILMIILPMIILISKVGIAKNESNNINNYIIYFCLIMLVVLGIIGLRNSLKKQKELNKK